MDYDKSQTFTNSLDYQVCSKIPPAYFIFKKSSESFRKNSFSLIYSLQCKYLFKNLSGMNHTYYSCHYPCSLIFYDYLQSIMRKNSEDLKICYLCASYRFLQTKLFPPFLTSYPWHTSPKHIQRHRLWKSNCENQSRESIFLLASSSCKKDKRLKVFLVFPREFNMTPASSLRAASSEICLSRCSSASFLKKLKTNILLKYSWFTRLYWLQVYSNVIWLYLYS